MKKTLLVLLMAICSIGFSQQKEPVTRTHYYYNVLNIENEQLLQQLVDEISAYKGVSGCKYRIKPEKKTAEIIFTFDEAPRKGEGDKGDPLPDAKKLILDKGLKYNGFTSQSEKITN